MRNPNQINNARRRETDAQGKTRVDGEAGHRQRREANALAPRGTTQNLRTPHTGATGTSHAKAGATTRASCAEAGSSSKLHEMNPRNSRATPHKRGQCASRMRCAGTPRPASPLTPPATPKRNTQEWQDSRVVHDSRGLCSEKTPFVARSSRGVFPKGDLQGISDTWRANLAKVSSFWMHGGDMLPGRGAFPVRGTFWDT